MSNDIPSCGKLLSIAEQCTFLSISRSQLYKYAAENDDFPKALKHPIAKGRRVRSQVELQQWIDQAVNDQLESLDE